jgi:hypothetical protein
MLLQHNQTHCGHFTPQKCKKAPISGQSESVTPEKGLRDRGKKYPRAWIRKHFEPKGHSSLQPSGADTLKIEISSQKKTQI